MGLSSELVSRLEGFVLEKMRENKVPGLSMTLVKESEVAYARGLGFRNIVSGLSATPRTLYGIGSVTKSFTALAVMQLVERGLLSLDDSVERYVPLSLRPFGELVKIRHLLTHTSGIPALGYAEAFIRGRLKLDELWLPLSSPEDVITFMRGAEGWSIAKPGERFFYLNEGYVLLGQIISKVSGLSYEDYVDRNILKPLGMSRTFFKREDVERDGDVAMPYIITKEGEHIESEFPYGVTADGGIISNAIDMAKYVSMYIGRGELNGVRIVSKESVEEMEEPKAKLPYEVLGEESYGYGLAISPNFFKRKMIGHSGSVLVYTAFMGYVPSETLGVIVLANPSKYPLSYIGMYALALAIGEKPEELPFVRLERAFSRLKGVYETYMGTFKLIVEEKGGALFITYRDKHTELSMPLVPEEIREDYARFYTLSAGWKVYAEFFVKDGEATLLYERYKLIKRSP